MSEETLNKLLESIDNALWDLKHNGCNVNTEEKNKWKMYYGLDDRLIKYIRNLEQKVEQLENIIKEAINYIDDNTYYKDHKGHINIDDVYIILQKGSEK